jgi:hypothetical protein
MTTIKPYLGPCRDSSAGVTDQHRYEHFSLPQDWANSHIKSGTWMGPDEYYWTPDGFFEANKIMTPELLHEIREKTGGSFYSLSLTEQCALLGIEYQKIHPADMVAVCANPPLDASKGVEEFSFDFYKNQDWAGDSGEGATIHLLSFMLKRRLDKLDVKYHNYYYLKLSNKLFPHGIFKRECIEAHEYGIIEQEVKSILDFSSLLDVYEIWNKHQNIAFGLPRKVTPNNLSLDDFLAVCQGLTHSLLTSITNLKVMGYTGMGWPDLTLQKDAKLKFVEVKQSQDKFTHRQAYWIRNFAIPLSLDFKVLHVAPSIKVGLKNHTTGKSNLK